MEIPRSFRPIRLSILFLLILANLMGFIWGGIAISISVVNEQSLSMRSAGAFLFNFLSLVAFSWILLTQASFRAIRVVLTVSLVVVVVFLIFDRSLYGPWIYIGLLIWAFVDLNTRTNI